MVLKYLDIQGFKSFPDKTRVDFSKGLTAVVGPNGSGKSNISDAVRWVLGEQSTKTLRGSKMEDVIFGGTQKRKSHGFAEVSIAIDNSKREVSVESDEVVITRKYYRSGDSEYMINRDIVRLKDINEIFMDTGLGYSLVGQGKIADIVQSKSSERREIFEEASGIARYRYRRHESQKNLKKSEENLERLMDIFNEIESRVEPLRIQSHKAIEYLKLAEEKRTLEISIWNETLTSSNAKLKDKSDLIVIDKTHVEELDEQLEQIEQGIKQADQKKQESLDKNEELRSVKEQATQEVAEVNSKRAVKKNDIEHNNRDIERLTNELKQCDLNVNQVDEQIGQSKSKIEQYQAELKENNSNSVIIAEQLEQNKQSLSATQVEHNELSVGINNISIEISTLEQKLEQSESLLGDNNATMQSKLEQIEQQKSKCQEYDDEINQLEESIKQLDEKQEELHNSQNGYKIKRQNQQQKLDKFKDEANTLELKLKENIQKKNYLDGLEQSLDGYAHSVKSIIKRKNEIGGIRGTVSQILQVPKEYTVAIETAIGGAMQNIVVDDENSAKKAINILKNDRLGRATFLPLTSIKGNKLMVNGLDAYDGYVGIASEIVSCQPEYKGIVDYLLSRTVVVDDIDTAVLIAKKNNYKFKVISLDGQVVNSGGSLTGGSKNKSLGILSRMNDIQKLATEIDKIRDVIEKSNTQLSVAQQDLEKLSAQLVAIESEITTLNEDKIKASSGIESTIKLKQQIEQLLATMEQDIENNDEFVRQQKSIIEKSKNGLQTNLAKKAELESRLQDLSKTNEDMDKKQIELTEQLNEHKLRQVELEKDIKSTAENLANLELTAKDAVSVKQNYNNQIEQINDSNKKIEAEIVELKISVESNEQKQKDIDEQLKNNIQEHREYEKQSTELIQNERRITQQRAELMSNISKLEEQKNGIQKEYDAIISKLWDEYELTQKESEQYTIKISSIQKAHNKLVVLKGKIKSLGTVNVEAVEEYRQIKERYDFLSKEIADIKKAKAEIEQLIAELTTTMEELFSENFERINRHFMKIFVELFGGGRALLKLTDTENILECGIEIFVEPPGKVIKNLTSLSGGEQAFVAIAIYFAILKVRPAPFCILDEIEAALDDVNVYKYAKYLGNFSDKTQFIAITHRRGTMECADVLYGVTMQEEGVSKLLTMNVEQAEQLG